MSVYILNLRIFIRIFQPKIGRKIRIFSLGRKNSILIKKKECISFKLARARHFYIPVSIVTWLQRNSFSLPPLVSPPLLSSSFSTSFVFSFAWSRRQKNHDRKKHTAVMSLQVPKTLTTTSASPALSYSKQWPFRPHLKLKLHYSFAANLRAATQRFTPWNNTLCDHSNSLRARGHSLTVNLGIALSRYIQYHFVAALFTCCKIRLNLVWG